MRIIDVYNKVTKEYLKDYPIYSEEEVLRDLIKDGYIEIIKEKNLVIFTYILSEKKQTITKALLETSFNFRDFMLFQKEIDGPWIITDTNNFKNFVFDMKMAGVAVETKLVEKAIAVIKKGVLTLEDKEELEEKFKETVQVIEL